ncbi:hypothetical protein [Streptomyces lydicus]|uniref:hypothetical protein n=1 Tax=Streptomyces lydicus TaxID=47763 RepID=UPI0036F72A65
MGEPGIEERDVHEDREERDDRDDRAPHDEHDERDQQDEGAARKEHDGRNEHDGRQEQGGRAEHDARVERDGRAGSEEGVASGEFEELDEPEEEVANRVGLTPRQARRIRIVLASVLMAAMAVVLVVRLASRTSVLVVGVYGAALVLCGVVIELSRHGRTRLGTWLLGIGLAAALASDWLLLP